MTQRGAWTPTKVRERIQTGVLIDRLENHAVGNIEMTQTQLKAAEILLKKALPDLQSVALTGADGEGPPELRVTAVDVRG